MKYVEAVKLAVKGKRLSRAAWSGSDFVCFVEGELCWSMDGFLMKWKASPSDVLASDWFELPE